MKRAMAKRQGSGFTILELLVVLAVMSIVLLISGPSMREYLENARTDNVIMSIYNDFLFAKAEALNRHDDVIMIFDPENSSYSILFDENSDWDPGESLSGGDEYLRRNVTLPDDYVFASHVHQIYGVDNEGIRVGVTFKNNLVYFQPSGRITDAHEDTLDTLVKLNNRAVYVIRTGDSGRYDYSHLRAVVANGLSGHPQVWKYRGVWVTRD